ncbi:class A beta-lactamase [Nocardiopsis sp. NRRL B-16309]|uniref:class A beta-lactamase n=1 Tax=Nocardiopsis sp. NRRL B-16309 TaxID=1519494 RepID=UPI0006B00112|nr:class A beta-lactamase [Nocardiopsis sp. NRRL B-16309]KOX15618.1 beta-lactamase [Nocardiopsis sp. NRRL B-16309]
MRVPITRHQALAALATVALAPLTACATPGAAEAPAPSASPTPSASAAAADADFARLEEDFDARLGVYALDTGSGEAVGYRAEERFAFASTIKVALFGALLERATPEELEKDVTITEDDLVNWNPVTEDNVGGDMSLLELGDAALRYSDNAATNLLLEELGGPDALDAALEEIGDDVTSVDRIEPGLNEAVPGDERDTSTPRAMATTLEAFTLGDVLPEVDREILTEMMRGNTTGDDLIRAGVPDGWEVGDRTGAGGYGTRNAIAVAWPPEDDPIVVVVMSSRDQEDAEYDDALIAQATEVVVETLS